MDEKTTEETGVIVRVRRDNAGRFLPGGPSANPEGGRKRKDAEREVLNAIANAVEPQQIADTILRLLFMDNWRANAAGVKLYMDNMVGAPVQRQPEAQEMYVQLLEKLRENARLRVVKDEDKPVDS